MKKTISAVVAASLLVPAFLLWYTHRSIEQQPSPQGRELKRQLEDPSSTQTQVLKSGRFNPAANDSDLLHRGRGNFKIVRFQSTNWVVLEDNFKVTNGPNYKLYLINRRDDIETENAFLAIKAGSHFVGNIQQFEGYQSFPIPAHVDLNTVKSALIWCETFSQFITSGKLQ